jgi:hypothetical protein
MHEAIPPLPQYAFMEWCLVKHRDNFTCTVYLIENVSVWMTGINLLKARTNGGLYIATTTKAGKFLISWI